MTNRNQLTPDEKGILKDFVKQFENNIQVLSEALDEYATQFKDVVLVSDNSCEDYTTQKEKPTKPNMRAWQQDFNKNRRRFQ